MINKTERQRLKDRQRQIDRQIEREKGKMERQTCVLKTEEDLF